MFVYISNLVLVVVLIDSFREGANVVGLQSQELSNTIDVQGRKEGKHRRVALLALEKSVEFYRQRYNEVNLDSVFGLRIAEGYLKKITTSIGTHETLLRSEEKEQIVQLFQDANAIIAKSLRVLKKNDPTYFHQFKGVLVNEWSYSEPMHSVNRKLIIRGRQKYGQSDGGFNEQVSDKCMTSIMGSNDNSISCLLPDDCWGYMVERNTEGYYLTHQALYFLLGEVNNCHEEIVHKLGGEHKWRGLLDSMAANIVDQMDHALESGITADGRDLFIEQAVVAAMLGAAESLSTDVLLMVVNWQDDVGCMKEADEGTRPEVGRKLLMEKQLNDGCMAHTTGLATGFFALYLHWLVVPASANATPLNAHTGVNLLSMETSYDSEIVPWPSVKSSYLMITYFGLILLGAVVFVVYMRAKRKGVLWRRHLRII